MKDAITPKEKLFQTAARLFYQQGYRAVGVDTLAAESGIGKMTLYRHFPSKDDLITAFLQDANREFWNYLNHSIENAPTPREKLIAFFEGLQQYVTSPACHGCPFNNIVAEYPQPDYSGHQIAVEHKLAVQQRFAQLASDAGACDPSGLANALVLLMDGAYTAARMFGSSGQNPAVDLVGAARTLIDHHCNPSP